MSTTNEPSRTRGAPAGNTTTVFVPAAESVGALLQQAVEKYGSSVALRRRRQPMQWSVVTWTELGSKVRDLGAGLLQLGVTHGDRVALLSRTRLEWSLIDYAILSIGAVSVPLYHSATPAGIASILKDSEATVLVVEDRTQLERVQPRLGELEHLRAVVVIDVMDLRDHPGASLLEEVAREGSRLLREDPERFEYALAAVDEESLATLVYTSGTTGTSKGVRLSHGAILAGARALDSVMNVTSDDTTVLCLPLSHIYARLGQFSALTKGFCLAYARRVDRLDEVLREVRPTFFFAVPRIFERIYQGVVSRYRELPPLLQAAFRQGMAASRRLQADHEREFGIEAREPQRKGRLSGRLAARFQGRLADKAIFEPVRDALGGRVRFCVSGGAPLNPDIARFFRLAGIEILEGYGLTETCAAGTINPLDDNRIGTVGRPLPGVRVRIAADGEVLIQGPVVFDGYHRRPEETAEVLTEDGWLHTGDVGRFDEAGYLVISDRKKDLIILSGAKNIAPQHVETTLRASPYVADAMVFGDRRPHLVALLTLDPGEVQRFAATIDLDTSSWSKVVRDPRIEELMAGEIERCNQRLARFEQVRAYKILPRGLSIEGGTLTPTFKVRRRAVEDRYRPLIEGMYEAP